MQVEDARANVVPDHVRQVHTCSQCGALCVAEPALKCRQCGEVLRLRCFYYRDGSKYVAECIDLDLAVERDTAADAVGELQVAMYGYLEAVFDGQSIKGLVPRPSPLSHRIRYHLEHFKASLSYRLRVKGKKRSSKDHSYPERVSYVFFEVPSGTHCY